MAAFQAQQVLDLFRHPGFKFLAAYLLGRRQELLDQLYRLHPLNNAVEMARKQGEIAAIDTLLDFEKMMQRVLDAADDSYG